MMHRDPGLAKAVTPLLFVMLFPIAAAAQSIGVAARAGTLGLGGEASVQVAPGLALRGGIGFFPMTVDHSFESIDYSISPTSPLKNIGVDFNLPVGLRFGAGLLFLSKETTIVGRLNDTFEINGTTYDGADAGELTGALDHGGTAPYALIGFGRAAGRGFGLFLDVGAAFLKEPSFALRASGPLAQHPQFQQDLEAERQEVESQLRDYHRVLPILSLGVRIGVR